MNMKKIVLDLLVACLLVAPAFAVTDGPIPFSAVATGTTSVETDIHSSVQPKGISGTSAMRTTSIVVYSDLVGADLTVKGYIADCAKTTLAVAASASQNQLTLASTSELVADDVIFIEDKSDANDYESAVILSVSSTVENVVALVRNLTHAYPISSVVFELKDVANYEPYAITTESETVYGNSANQVSVPAGSPMSVQTTGTALCKISVAGIKE